MHTRLLAVLLALIALVASLTAAQAADPLKKPEEFRGIRWEAPVTSIPGMTAVDRDGDIVHYDRAGEKLDLGGIPLRHVTYSFYKGKFYHADIGYEEAGAFEALERSLEEKYGPPDSVRQKTDASGHAYEVAVWNWPGYVFIGNRHEKDSSRGRIFYFYDPLTDASAKGQGLGTAPAPGQGQQGPTYTVQKGDTLSRVAHQLGVTEDDLTRANPGLSDKKLKAGATIAVPAAAAPKTGKASDKSTTAREPLPGASPSRTSAPAETKGDYVNYTVKDGDILSKVANAHGARTKDVITANPGINPDALRLGSVLRIPIKSSEAQTIESEPAAP